MLARICKVLFFTLLLTGCARFVPVGGGAQSDSSTTHPDGGDARSDSSTTYPDGGDAQSDSSTTRPDGGDATVDAAGDAQPTSDAAPADVPLNEATISDASTGPCTSSTLKVHDLFGDSSALATYLFDHDFKSLVQVTASYGVYDALPSGGASLATGAFASAASLGSGATLRLDGVPLPTGAQPRAFSLWLHIDQQVAGQQAILTYGEVAGATGAFFSLVISSDDELIVDVGGQFLHSGLFPLTNRWYHLLVSYDGSALEISVDGVRMMSESIALQTSTTDEYGKVLGDYDGASSLHGRIDQLRIFTRGLSQAEATALATECMYPDPAPGQSFTTLVYEEDFGGNLTAWNRWGTPTPRIIDDAEAENGKAFDTNGDANYHSGADSNFSLPYDQDFAVEFRAKQPQDTTISNKWLYLELGLTHTISSGNGTGPLVYALISGIQDTNKWELFNPFGLHLYVAGDAHIYWDYWNDYAYHVYRIEHVFDGGESYFRFFVDGVLYERMRREETTTTPWYITLQGRSYGTKDNHVDWVRIYTP